MNPGAHMDQFFKAHNTSRYVGNILYEWIYHETQ